MNKTISLLSGPLLFLIVLLLPIEGLSSGAQGILASTAWIVSWWVTEAIPIPATSLLPIILFPLTGGLELSATTSSYMHPMIVLFMGGFIIALAIEKWNLHQRIALNTIRLIGTNTRSLILGFMLATMLLSMWISNTATALMMLPIGLAIARKMKDLGEGQDASLSGRQSFDKTLMLAIAYAASIGGIATLIGTPTNAIMSAIVQELYGIEITFARWFSFGLPISIILLAVAWLYLTRIVLKGSQAEGMAAQTEIAQQVGALGKISVQEKRVLAVFIFTALAWILRSFVLVKILPGIHDAVIAVFGALLLFVIPAGKEKKKLMDWQTATTLPWGILILFGGGLAIAAGFKDSGLAEWVGIQFSDLSSLPFFLILFIVLFSVNFLTEVTSNVATASVLLPILALLAVSMNVHPFTFMVGASIAASCAFMLPVATPPNAIAYSSGYLQMKDMIRAGFWMNLISTTILFFCIRYLLPLIWKLEILDFKGF